MTHSAKAWTRMRRVQFNSEERARRARLIAGSGVTDVLPESEVWINDEYQATVAFTSEAGRDGGCHLSVKRRDRSPAHDWRDLQAIKNELLGPEREAIELYPAESRLVDQADQTHLWVLPTGVTLEIGFQEREVLTDMERRAKLGAIDPVAATKGSQRDWRPGISTGPDYRRIT